MNGYQTMGLVMGCADGRTYTIRFSIERGVQVIKVRPSRCALTELVFTDADGFVKRRVRPPLAWRQSERYAARHAYYLGDYFAKAKLDSEWKVLYAKLHWSWEMDRDVDDYDDTTVEMRRSFPSLAALPTENKRLGPVERRRDSEDAAAVTPPGEVPLSPERTRGLARFIKRSYATPAACDAACPTGECLPFSGEAGPAMACVVRCKADKDCPAGLACNCPTSDGPDCRLVARTESDPMEGFCLSVESHGPRR